MEVFARPRHARRAFTLVELLTVIVIIGILAGLIAAAVVSAVNAAKEARVRLEIGSLDKALKDYKNKYGDYPPYNMSDQAAVRAHLRRAFPRYPVGGGDPYTQFVSDLGSYGLAPGSMDSASALVFWLGGVNRNGSGSPWVPNGFSVDVERPFRADGPRLKTFFEFDPERIRMQGGQIHYCPEIAGALAADRPYVYFRARTNGYTGAVAQLGVLPYMNGNTGQWANPTGVQIISAGRDNQYGSVSGTPTFPGNLSTEHYDNLTNFTERRLEDAIQ
jgi:prepilin-type N-terminal cleavage/methylation domain-containing protein